MFALGKNSDDESDTNFVMLGDMVPETDNEKSILADQQQAHFEAPHALPPFDVIHVLPPASCHRISRTDHQHGPWLNWLTACCRFRICDQLFYMKLYQCSSLL